MAVLEMPRMTSEEVAKRADEIYARRFKSWLEPEHTGEFLALDVLSEEYEMGTNKYEALERLLERLSHHQIFLIRIGFEAAAEIGVLGRSC